MCSSMMGAEKLPLVKMYLSLFLAVEQRKESVTSMALLFVLLCEESLGTSGDSLRVGGAVLQAVEVWEEWKEVSLRFTLSSHGCAAPCDSG